MFGFYHSSICHLKLHSSFGFAHSNCWSGLPGPASPLQYPNLMATDSGVSVPSAPLVAICAWLLPGSGYLLLGQRGRGLGIGITIIVLFILGLLIAGVRVIEVPGYDVSTGARSLYPIQIPGSNRHEMIWVIYAAPLSEIRDKPWSVPQVLTGPISILAGAWSVYAAQSDPVTGQSVGALSHARLNEIGSLYLSVAGLLNLMAIIDSAWRASHIAEQRAAKEPA